MKYLDTFILSHTKTRRFTIKMMMTLLTVNRIFMRLHVKLSFITLVLLKNISVSFSWKIRIVSILSHKLDWIILSFISHHIVCFSLQRERGGSFIHRWTLAKAQEVNRGKMKYLITDLLGHNIIHIISLLEQTTTYCTSGHSSGSVGWMETRPNDLTM